MTPTDIEMAMRTHIARLPSDSRPQATQVMKSLLRAGCDSVSGILTAIRQGEVATRIFACNVLEILKYKRGYFELVCILRDDHDNLQIQRCAQV